MFQPFSQENPLQTGTGLGLAIVNSIVKSEGIRGKVDVDSTEGVGTEIRITIEAERPSNKTDPDAPSHLVNPSLSMAVVYMDGFETAHLGQKLLQDVVANYLTDWWDVSLTAHHNRHDANIILLNEDVGVLVDCVRRQDTSRPIILLTASRGNHEVSAIVSSFHDIGGDCFVVYKPVRPSFLFKALEQAVSALTRSPGLSRKILSPLSQQWRPALSARTSLLSEVDQDEFPEPPSAIEPPAEDLTPQPQGTAGTSRLPITRRYSEELPIIPKRPTFARSSTAHVPFGLRPSLGSTIRTIIGESSSSSVSTLGSLNMERGLGLMSPLLDGSRNGTRPGQGQDYLTAAGVSPTPSSSSSILGAIPMTPVGSDRGVGEMLPTVVGTLPSKATVLIVEDNHVNRALLAQWLRKRVCFTTWSSQCPVPICSSWSFLVPFRSTLSRRPRMVNKRSISSKKNLTGTSSA